MQPSNSSGIAGFVDCEPPLADFAAEVLDGLARPVKRIPSKFFYDKAGSELFDRICELEEYYPTRTETALLEAHKADLARLIGRGSHLIEYGSGSSQKIRILLDALTGLASYTAVEISREHLIAAAEALARDYPRLAVYAVCADYTQEFALPAPVASASGKRVGFFPGSTIGNFRPEEAREFMRNAAALLGAGGELIVGADLKKDRAVLYAAYNDRDGVTAAFNLNLLERINRELGGDFDLDGFAHEAVYNDAKGRMEMHIQSLRDQTVSIRGRQFGFRAGESIHTENSYKYTIDEFHALAREAGFVPVATWTDAAPLFSIHYLRCG